MVVSRNRKPEDVRTPYDVVVVPPGKQTTFVCLTSSYASLQVHYTGKGSKYCPENDSCKSCLAGNAQIFCGYVIGQCVGTGKRLLYHLTGLAASNLCEQEWRGQSLHGGVIQLRRIGLSKRSPVTAEIMSWRKEPAFIAFESLEHAVRTLHKLHSTQGKPVLRSDARVPEEKLSPVPLSDLVNHILKSGPSDPHSTN